MTETVRRVRQDSLGIYRHDADFECRFVDPGANVTDLIENIAQDPFVVKVIHEVPPPHALGLVPHEVWVRQDDHLTRRPYETGRLQADVDPGVVADVCRAHGARRLCAFGSVTNDYFDPHSSDIDVIVEYRAEEGRSLLDMAGLAADLSDQVFEGREVDVVTAESARRSRLLRGVGDEALVLYEESD